MKGRNYCVFWTTLGMLLCLEMDLSAGTRCTQSLLQGEHLQERSGKLGKLLPKVGGKLANFDAKWSQNGVWDPSGAKMAPGRQKKPPTIENLGRSCSRGCTGRFSLEQGLLCLEVDLRAETRCTQSLLQGEQLQESVNKCCIFPQKLWKISKF